MVELPETIALTVRVDGRPAADVPVVLVVDTARKNAFATLPRLTDATGRIAFTRQEIAAAAAESKRLFPADYGELDKDATGLLRLEVLGPRDVFWARTAYGFFQERWPYPDGYAQILERAEKACERYAELDFELAPESAAQADSDDAGEAEIAVVDLHRFRPEPSREAKMLPLPLAS